MEALIVYYKMDGEIMVIRQPSPHSSSYWISAGHSVTKAEPFVQRKSLWETASLSVKSKTIDTPRITGKPTPHSGLPGVNHVCI